MARQPDESSRSQRTDQDSAASQRLPDWVSHSGSLAYALVSLRDVEALEPLYPQRAPYVASARKGRASPEIGYPLEVAYRYAELRHGFFEPGLSSGVERWQALLPPLMPGLTMGEGDTPLAKCRTAAAWAGVPRLLVKDESRNPTWSHKDRLSLCTVSAAVAAGATGTVISTSGNHGASAAAYSARAGLRCIVLCDDGVSTAQSELLRAYGAAVVSMPREARWPLLTRLARCEGFYLVGNVAETHTGHPFGPEGYKPIAYEIFAQLGGTMPGAVVVPTSYGELLFGIAKGFQEIASIGLSATVPMLVSAEPESAASLAAAWRSNQLSVTVTPAFTVARGIGSSRSGYRGIWALRRSNGLAVTVSDSAILEAQAALAADGIWAEPASCAGLAACRVLAREGALPSGPLVHVSTSSGLKSVDQSARELPRITSADWDDLKCALRQQYGLSV